MSQHTELIARLRRGFELGVYGELRKLVNEAADALQAMERQKQPDDLKQIIDAFVEDYEMIGEDEDGRDACYTPTETERGLIKDAICGLLAYTDWENAWGDLINYQAQQRTGERVPMTTADMVKVVKAAGWPADTNDRQLVSAFNLIEATEAHHGITPPESKG